MIATEPKTDAEMTAAEFRDVAKRIETEIAKVMVGRTEIGRDVLSCRVGGGHALPEGVPGLGKTMLGRPLGDAPALTFGRIQFTPDLRPADTPGTNTLVEDEPGTRR